MDLDNMSTVAEFKALYRELTPPKASDAGIIPPAIQQCWYCEGGTMQTDPQGVEYGHLRTSVLYAIGTFTYSYYGGWTQNIPSGVRARYEIPQLKTVYDLGITGALVSELIEDLSPDDAHEVAGWLVVRLIAEVAD